MKIFMMGDSTMKYNNILTYPQTGWGQVVELFVNEGVRVIDYAENGRSTKSFIAEGRFQRILDEIDKGDFVICQFGHNDEKINDPSRYTEPYGEYQKNLAYFHDEVLSHGGNIVYATSITRHKFSEGKCINSHGLYPQAMLDFCKENGYTCIDMNQLTIDLYTKLGEEATKKFHMIFPAQKYSTYIDGMNDHSHLVYEGAIRIAELFVRAIYKTNDPIKKLFLNLDSNPEIDWKMLKD